jgi:FMN phosphatase YigB (HAD superfamily)
MSKRVYVDMDGVLVDFESGIQNLSPEDQKRYKNRYDAAPDIFDLMEPMPGALEAFAWLRENFEVYILSTAPWRNPRAWMSKRLWVSKYLGKSANGAGEFEGELIQFGKGQFKGWPEVINYLETHAE